MRTRILDLIVEKSMLIEGMSEGLLILNETEESSELINRQARKLLRVSESTHSQF